MSRSINNASQTYNLEKMTLRNTENWDERLLKEVEKALDASILFGYDTITVDSFVLQKNRYNEWILLKYLGSDEEIEVPFFITRICRKAFNACISLRKVKLPQSIQIIEAEAFGNCKNLNEINFPDALFYIGNLAFEKTDLKRVILSERKAQEQCRVFLCDYSAAIISIPNSILLGGMLFSGIELSSGKRAGL